MRLKSRYQSPPNGFIYIQPQTGWDNRKHAPASQWDFQLLCRSLQEHRIANRARFPGLSTDLNAIQDEVETVNVLRIRAMPGAETYLMGDTRPPKQIPPTLSHAQNVAGALKKTVIGASILLDWERSGEPPVPAGLAQRRAETCAARGEDKKPCPKMGQGDWSAYFLSSAAALIRKHMERAKELKMETTLDDKLGVCEACLCPMRLKVHTPIRFIQAKTPQEIIADLDPGCWMLAEMGK